MSIATIAASGNSNITINSSRSVLYISTNGAGSATLKAIIGCGNFSTVEFSGQRTFSFQVGGVVNLAMSSGGSCSYEVNLGSGFGELSDAKLSTNVDGSTAGIVGNGGAVIGLGIFNMSPTDYYGFALRSGQGGFGSPLDQSGKLNDPQINANLFPAVRLNSTAYTVGQYRSPAVQNGKLFKCTTAGTTAASEPAGIAAATVGATITDGTAVWTCERGAWTITAAGLQHITPIASGLIGNVSGVITCPAIAWDMAAGDSLIVRVRQAWNGAATDSRTALSENSVIGNRHISVATSGFRIIATGTTYADLKFSVSDGTTLINSGHVGAGFNRKPLDGNVHDTVFMVDGLLKRAYGWTDGVSYSQAEMFSGSEKTPHNMDLSTITGSTLTANNILIGSMPGNTTTYDFGIICFDVFVLPARGLPTNTQAIADFFYSRGASALLPASLLK